MGELPRTTSEDGDLTEERRLARAGAAAFLAQALGIGGGADQLERDLIVLERDGPVTTYAVELDSSVGPAAFVVYAYRLDATDAVGRSGADRLAADAATMERADELDAPGPRLVAQAEAGPLAFLLAATPALLRTLSDPDSAPPHPDGAPGASPPLADVAAEFGTEVDLNFDRARARRAGLAGDVLDAIRTANRSAADWLALADLEPNDLTTEEAELALHLVDPGSLSPLLTMLRRLTQRPPADAT